LPLIKCEKNNEKGYKWGESGNCYIGKNAKKEAIKQAVAIGKGKFPEDVDDTIKDMVAELEKEYEDACKKKNDSNWEHEAIIKSKDDFEGGSFENKWDYFPGINGIWAVIGDLKDNVTGNKELQKLSFNIEPSD
jgi:hypothetical protein